MIFFDMGRHFRPTFAHECAIDTGDFIATETKCVKKTKF